MNMKRFFTLFFGMVLSSSASIVFASSTASSFTPTSIKIPIRAINLMRDDGDDGVVYSCEGETDSECLVDIADTSALEALTEEALSSIPVGTYNKIQVATCEQDGGSYDAYVKGSTTISSTTYYTSSGSDPLTTSSGSLDYAKVSFSGCSAEYTLPSELTLNTGDSIQISLFIALENIAWGELSTSTIPSGCINGTSNSVCLSYPHVVPYVGSTTPSLETYYVDDTADGGTAGGQILLIIDSEDNILGGFARRLFDSTSGATFGTYDTPLKTTIDNGNGTYTVEATGDSATGPGYIKFSAFERATHSGSYTTPINSGGPHTYTATKQ